MISLRNTHFPHVIVSVIYNVLEISLKSNHYVKSYLNKHKSMAFRREKEELVQTPETMETRKCIIQPMDSRSSSYTNIDDEQGGMVLQSTLVSKKL